MGTTIPKDCTVLGAVELAKLVISMLKDGSDLKEFFRSDIRRAKGGILDMLDEEANNSKVRYLYGEHGRICGGHKREGECALPGEI
jgi:hypothetical protein